MERAKYRPFTGDESTSIRTDGTLPLVLCQLQWPALTSLQGTKFGGQAMRLGQALTDYPLMEKLQELTVQIGPQGNVPAAVDLYRWTTVGGDWSINLTQQFVSLYTTSYSDFKELDQRIEAIADLLQTVLEIPCLRRLGLRFINRFPDRNLGGKFHSAVLGAALLDEPADSRTELRQSMVQAVYSVDGRQLFSRAGFIGPGEIIDPVLGPESERSWILDIDASCDQRMLLSASEVTHQLSQLADITYDYFRYVTLPEFHQENQA